MRVLSFHLWQEMDSLRSDDLLVALDTTGDGKVDKIEVRQKAAGRDD